jgi:hypothetical protein
MSRESIQTRDAISGIDLVPKDIETLLLASQPTL